jgi:predicted RNase H-like HicB family nuclease
MGATAAAPGLDGAVQPGSGRYTAEFRLDGDGMTWLVQIREIPPCHTYGKSVAQARRRAREALRLFVGDADTAELVDDIQLPDEIGAHVKAAHDARVRAAAEQTRAQEATLRAARDLVDRLGLSVRDAAQVLGLSHQRVQQLLAS